MGVHVHGWTFYPHELVLEPHISICVPPIHPNLLLFAYIIQVSKTGSVLIEMRL